MELALTYLGKFRKFAQEPYKTTIMDTLLRDIDYEPGSMIDQWVKEGFEKGIEKGFEKGKKLLERERELNVVRMLKRGFSVKDICEILELDEDYVLRIKRKNNL